MLNLIKILNKPIRFKSPKTDTSSSTPWKSPYLHYSNVDRKTGEVLSKQRRRNTLNAIRKLRKMYKEYSARRTFNKIDRLNRQEFKEKTKDLRLRQKMEHINVRREFESVSNKYLANKLARQKLELALKKRKLSYRVRKAVVGSARDYVFGATPKRLYQPYKRTKRARSY